MSKQYYVYILSSKRRVLYVGVTGDLETRVRTHKSASQKGFTSRYNVNRLVWFDSVYDVQEAIEFEKKIKGWKRFKKVALIESQNPEWLDLAADWE